ncbi:hypothetical protein BPA01_35740 [Brevibacillus parabrevis]|uniref:Uncharacterized protein n=1 Tax=Brevibacillus parabrevis TaxID=54914 RepID=A0A4Y3PKW3_BREPA|nr:hypothetical protein BPA01_35740 [Brevibacillus parabrevis]
MQIIGPANFSQIKLQYGLKTMFGVAVKAVAHFVPRHMKRMRAMLGVPFQLFIQGRTLLSLPKFSISHKHARLTSFVMNITHYFSMI